MVEILTLIGLGYIGWQHWNTSNQKLLEKSAKTPITMTPAYFKNSDLVGGNSDYPEVVNSVTNYLSDQDFKGAIVVNRGKTLVLQRGFGELNKAAGISYDYNTNFPMIKSQQLLNSVMLLTLAKDKKINPVRKSNYLPSFKKNISLKEVILNQVKLTPKTTDGSIENSSDLDRVGKELYAGDNDSGNQIGLAYLIQKISKQTYTEYLKHFQNMYADLNLNTNDDNNLNVAKAFQNHRKYGINNVNIDTRSLAVLNALASDIEESQHMDVHQLNSAIFGKKVGRHSYLSQSKESVLGITLTSGHFTYVFQTSANRSTKYYYRLVKHLDKLYNDTFVYSEDD